MTKGSKVARSKDALNFITLANTEPARRDTHLLWARMVEAFGRYNENHGYHHGRRPAGSSKFNKPDDKSLEWMKAESARTGETRAQTLAKACARAGKLLIQGGTEQSAIERIARKWRTLR